MPGGPCRHSVVPSSACTTRTAAATGSCISAPSGSRSPRASRGARRKSSVSRQGASRRASSQPCATWAMAARRTSLLSGPAGIRAPCPGAFPPSDLSPPGPILSSTRDGPSKRSRDTEPATLPETSTAESPSERRVSCSGSNSYQTPWERLITSVGRFMRTRRPMLSGSPTRSSGDIARRAKCAHQAGLSSRRWNCTRCPSSPVMRCASGSGRLAPSTVPSASASSRTASASRAAFAAESGASSSSSASDVPGAAHAIPCSACRSRSQAIRSQVLRAVVLVVGADRLEPRRARGVGRLAAREPGLVGHDRVHAAGHARPGARRGRGARCA